MVIFSIPVRVTPLRSIVDAAAVSTVISEVVMLPETEVSASRSASTMVTVVPSRTKFSTPVRAARAAD